MVRCAIPMLKYEDLQVYLACCECLTSSSTFFAYQVLLQVKVAPM